MTGLGEQTLMTMVVSVAAACALLAVLHYFELIGLLLLCAGVVVALAATVLGLLGYVRREKVKACWRGVLDFFSALG